MASRIFWFLVAGFALVGGIIIQDGNGIFSWRDDADRSHSVEQRIEARIDQAIERSFDRRQLVVSHGQEVDVPEETKRALADAVRRLVKAETDLALLHIRDGTDEEVQAATIRRDQARAAVETLKANMEGQRDEAQGSQQGLRDEIRAEVREAVRDAVRN